MQLIECKVMTVMTVVRLHSVALQLLCSCPARNCYGKFTKNPTGNINPSSYFPDSVDLLKDSEARKYWLSCLEGLGHQFVDKACFLHCGDLTATSRAEKCREKFHQILNKLKEEPLMLGSLSVRSLLDLNEEIIRENGFDDAWWHQKHIETKAALLKLNQRLEQVDAIKNEGQRMEELCKGVIAGNMFDWGAKAILELFKDTDDFGLDEALSKIQPRPWLIDDLDKWTQRLEQGPVYKCVVIFVDNAGIDLVLGILPLAREFLKHGSTVILSANSKPALNDITHEECEKWLKAAPQTCPVIHQALITNKLLFYESGGRGPCLDLANLHPDLCGAMAAADLVILEGMGRAVHTNLHAQFKVDCLKVAVIKNEWWARRLGGDKFSVLFQYEPAA